MAPRRHAEVCREELDQEPHHRRPQEEPQERVPRDRPRLEIALEVPRSRNAMHIRNPGPVNSHSFRHENGGGAAPSAPSSSSEIEITTFSSESYAHSSSELPGPGDRATRSFSSASCEGDAVDAMDELEGGGGGGERRGRKSECGCFERVLNGE
uniref:Uncharacterized protein n=1 Tax=Ananas comosus var. bracteatus TaxID=296719 RepID=A0A6V7PNZ2_ANACO|nr:unnamed protein product [Ananas comosus var. bracteatus]